MKLSPRLRAGRGFSALLLLPLLCSAAPEPPSPFDPTTAYAELNLEGWTIHVNRALLKEHAEIEQRIEALLRVKLFEITRVVPAGPLAELRKVPFWIEFTDREFPCMCYHPSADWLREHGYNPDKAGGVEIAGAENFLKWTLDQPWMVLHELAHSYHDRVLGFDNAEVKAAYDAAVKSHNYDAVLHFDGQTVKAYALNNEQEYFAECSEAFFGTNDFYPFVRSELAKHDPEMHRLLMKLWKTPTR